MLSYIEILRPLNGLMAILAVIIGAIVAGVPFSPLHMGIIFASLAAFLQSGAGMVLNDYFDREIDKINRPLRAIPSGRISPNAAKFYAVALFAASLIFAWMINIYAFALATFNLIVFFIYAYDLKKTPYGHFVVSYLVASVYIFASLIAEKVSALIIILSCLAFLANAGREIAKGIEDFRGDKKMKAKTFEIEFGKENAAVAGIFLTAAAIFLSPAPLWFGIKLNYIFVVAIADLIFVYCSYLLFKSRTETLEIAAKTSAAAQKFYKIGMIVALAAFVAGIL